VSVRVPSAGTATVIAPTDHGPSGRLARVVVSLPELFACAVAGFSVGPMVLLLAGDFTKTHVLVAGLVGAVIAVRLRGVDTELPDWRDVTASVVAMLAVIAWFLANLGKTAENVYATRDPATYDITARWLMNHPTLHIATHPELFGSPTQCSGPSALSGCAFPGGAGFSPVRGGSVLYAQGNHLQPALGAVAGWLFGTGGLFRVNVFLAAVGLLAFFALARRVVGGPFALLAMSALAVSMPLLYVSRDMYSEPLMLLFLTAGAALLHRAFVTNKPLDFALAGFVAGCAALVRIDSYAALLAFVVAAAVVVATARKEHRKDAVACGLALMGAAALPVAIGWLDLTWLSYGYYRDQRSDILHEVAAAVLLLVVSAALVAICWTSRGRWRADDALRRRAAIGGIGVLVAVFLVLLSRPLWFEGHGPFNPTLTVWQAQAGVAVNGSRSYTESSLWMTAQYIGWPALLLGVFGYAILLHRLIRRRERALTIVLALGLSISALYVWNWQITPDQPWAMRRYVPVVLPFLLLAAAAALRTVAARRTALAWVAALAGGAAMVILPARATTPMKQVRDEVPQLAQVQQLCAALSAHGAVVAVDFASLYGYGQTLRSYCGAPVIGLVDASPTQLRDMNTATAAHDLRLYVMAQDAAALHLAPGERAVPYSTVTVQTWPNVIGQVPTKAGTRTTSIYLGTVGADGTVTLVGQR
jgi:hypothetical protein